MIVTVIFIIGGALLSFFSFSRKIDTDNQLKFGISIAHRLTGSTDCFIYVNKNFGAQRNVLDAHKLAMATLNYGSSPEITLVEGIGIGNVEHPSKLGREHPCAYLTGWRWHAEIFDLEWFQERDETTRKVLAKKYRCSYYTHNKKSICRWSFGKKLGIPERQEIHLHKETREKKIIDFCKKLKLAKVKCKELLDCGIKGMEKIIGKKSAPRVKKPVVIIVLDNSGKVERHQGLLVLYAIRGEEICKVEKYGDQRFNMHGDESINLFREKCCFYDISEPVCLFNIERLLEAKDQFLYGPPTAMFKECPDFNYDEIGIWCKCVPVGMPVEIISITAPSVIKGSTNYMQSFFIKVKNRNWVSNAIIENISLIVNGANIDLCGINNLISSWKNCGFDETNTIFIPPKKILKPREIATYIFRGFVHAPLKGKTKATMVGKVTYTIDKFKDYEWSALLKAKKDICKEYAKGKIRCSHILETFATVENVEDLNCEKSTPCGGSCCRNNQICCHNTCCPPGYVCCSTGACVKRGQASVCEGGIEVELLSEEIKK
jgi:hypothetical protein